MEVYAQMRIGKLAAQFDVSTDWLRRLERSGRIPAPPRDLVGHRRYRPEDIEAIRQILFPAQQDRRRPGEKSD